MRMILLCFLAFLGYASSTNVLDPRYATSCRLAATEVEPTYSSDCFVALFSYATFAYTGRFITLNHDLCSIPNISDIDRTVAAVVKRGNCSFIEKAKNAQSAGFGLLIIANNEPDAFPMGPPLADFEIKIPVLMSGQDLWVWAVSMSTDQLQAHVQSDGRPTTSIPLLPMLSVTFGEQNESFL